MKIIFLNRFFYPDISATSQMLSDQAFALARDGHEVVVIAARQTYANPNDRLPPREQIQGVTVHRVWTSSFGRHRLVGRAVDYASFFLTAAGQLARIARPGDIVVTKTDPPLLSLLTTPLCALRGAKSVNWLQDIFPEVAERLGVGRNRLARLGYAGLRKLRNVSLRAAHKNVVLGTVMQRNVEDLDVPASRIVQIPNWADGAAIKPIARRQNTLRADWEFGDDFVVAHSGNLGRAHDAQAFVAAIERLEHGLTEPTDGLPRPHPSDPSGSARADTTVASGANAPPSIRWLFIGGGAQFAALEQAVADKGLRSVTFKPYQPRERLAESLSAADVHLVTLRPELEGLIVPSKVYGCLAAGRPIVFVGAHDGEIGRLVRENHCGCVLAPDDTEGLARAITTLARTPDLVAEMGYNARRAFDRDFDLRHAQRRWRALIDDLQAHSQTVPGTLGEGPSGPVPRVNLGEP